MGMHVVGTPQVIIAFTLQTADAATIRPEFDSNLIMQLPVV
jgi:hypothetical protein